MIILGKCICFQYLKFIYIPKKLSVPSTLLANQPYYFKKAAIELKGLYGSFKSIGPTTNAIAEMCNNVINRFLYYILTYNSLGVGLHFKLF